MFNIIGPAPSKSGHAYSFVKCSVCGAEKTCRKSLVDKLRCSCAGQAPVQDPAPGTHIGGPTGRAAPRPEIQALMHQHQPVLAPVQMDFTALEERIEAYMASTNHIIQQQAADFASWREKWEADMRAFMEDVIIGSVSSAQPTQDQIDAQLAEVERRVPLTYQSVAGPQEGRIKRLWDSHKLGALLADEPFETRTPDIKRELLERWKVIIEQLDGMPEKELYAALQPYAAKMKRSLDNWDNPNYDPLDHPINTETSA